MELPRTDPGYLEDQIALDILVEAHRFTIKISETEPFKSLLNARHYPNPSVQLATDQDVRSQLAFFPCFRAVLMPNSQISSVRTSKPHGVSPQVLLEVIVLNHHATDTCGTASMLPEDAGGAVDPQLRIYGMKNLRVVDLSVLPLQIAVHTQCKHTLSIVFQNEAQASYFHSISVLISRAR